MSEFPYLEEETLHKKQTKQKKLVPQQKSALCKEPLSVQRQSVREDKQTHPCGRTGPDEVEQTPPTPKTPSLFLDLQHRRPIGQPQHLLSSTQDKKK